MNYQAIYRAKMVKMFFFCKAKLAVGDISVVNKDLILKVKAKT